MGVSVSKNKLIQFDELRGIHFHFKQKTRSIFGLFKKQFKETRKKDCRIDLTQKNVFFVFFLFMLYVRYFLVKNFLVKWRTLFLFFKKSLFFLNSSLLSCFWYSPIPSRDCKSKFNIFYTYLWLKVFQILFRCFLGKKKK